MSPRDGNLVMKNSLVQKVISLSKTIPQLNSDYYELTLLVSKYWPRDQSERMYSRNWSRLMCPEVRIIVEDTDIHSTVPAILRRRMVFLNGVCRQKISITVTD